MSLHFFQRGRWSRPVESPRRPGLSRARLALEALEDRTLLATFVVTNTEIDGANGSLRDAILDANTNPGPDVISFNIPGAGVHTIRPTRQLPAITGIVEINGTTQPGWTPDRPVIELDGSLMTEGHGLEILIGGNTVKGLVVHSFPAHGMVFFEGSAPNPLGSNVIQGNFIGTDATGTIPKGNGSVGLHVISSPDNTIGGTAQGEGNLISGNQGYGMVLSNAISSGNRIFGNRIGTDITGMKPLGNKLDGIFLTSQLDPDGIDSASDNFIGLPRVGEGNVLETGGNVIAGNGRNGIRMFGGSGNKVQNSYIGVGLDGLTPIPNGTDDDSFNGNGVVIENGVLNVVGGTEVGTGNIISANKQDGVKILAFDTSASLHRVQGNLIGTDVDGEFLGNGGNGVELINMSLDESVFVFGSLIGGADASDGTVDGQVLARNVISGNLGHGILLVGPRVDSTVIEGNYIGTDKIGAGFVSNLLGGIKVTGNAGESTGPSGTVIGSSRAGGGNVISGNGNDGIQIVLRATRTSVVGNRIGTTADGLTALGNGPLGHGVYIENASDNLIGGTTDGEGNVISGQSANGVTIAGNASNNRVQKNLIGVGADLSTKLPNNIGVSIEGLEGGASPFGNWIGGTQGTGEDTSSLGNVIAANRFHGVQIIFEATANLVIGNWIGTNFDGEDLGNGEHGVFIFESSLNVIGGTTPAADNLMDNNGGAGVRIQGAAATANSVVGNHIVRNGRLGVEIIEGASFTTVDENVISDNQPAGVYIEESNGTILTNNVIGTDPDGAEPWPNRVANEQGGFGVWIVNAAGTVIGGASVVDDGNLISGNESAGIALFGPRAIGTLITGNYIGTDVRGQKRLGNEEGVVIVGSSELGGAPSNTTVRGNVISANRVHGVRILLGAFENQIAGNYIGTNSDGDDGLGNGGSGVFIDNSPRNTVGGDLPNTGNVIESNTEDGVRIQGTESALNDVRGNWINSNGFTGIYISDGPGATIIDSNEISGNKHAAGVLIEGAILTTLTNNFIGTTSGGTQPLPNLGPGVFVFDSRGTTIGGESFEDGGNLISGNQTAGVALAGSRTTDVRITGNFIGTDITGTKRLGNELGIAIGGTDQAGAASKSTVQGNLIAGNRSHGIRIDASDNTIGGPEEPHGNRIVSNDGAGVLVNEGTCNAILRNLIFANGDQGIELGGDGLTLNDWADKDRDTGPNNLQNYPELDFATEGASRRIAGTLRSAPDTIYTLHFYATSKQEYGHAERFVTSTQVTTNSSGVAFFDILLPMGVGAGSYITATATDPNGNTSEFAESVEVEVDIDGDGIPNRMENQGLNGGDANQDGVLDSLQANVVTFPNATNGGYVTLQLGTAGNPAPIGAVFRNARAQVNPSPDDAPDAFSFGLGFFEFTVIGLAPGASVVVEMILPAGSGSISYWRYGPTSDEPAPHWYLWGFDGQTGAENNGNRVSLHFVDGARGDDDLLANGTIVDPGGPGFAPPILVTNTLNSGAGSLRQAIVDANSRPGLDFINFAIGSGVATITPLSNLPAITDPVIIDGTTQPGFVGRPIIELNGQMITGGTGLTISTQHTLVRGLVINRFASRGISVGGFNFQSGVVIVGNYIGTDVTGTLALGNGDGIVLAGVQTRIGGATPKSRNVISGNIGDGIVLSAGSGHLIQGNLIGLAADAVSPLGNDDGIFGSTHLQMIGGLDAGAGNVIAFNKGAGIRSGGLILSNSIYSNGGLGIGTNVTLNDAGTSDGSLGNPINFPVLSSAHSADGETTISGYLNSRPNSRFLIQFFSNTEVEIPGFGEGRTLLAASTVETDDSGHVDFTVTFPVTVPDRHLITATATLSLSEVVLVGETSQFSRRLAVGDVLTQVITVNSGDDVDDGVADATHTSLREAIHAANNFPGPNTIRFAIGSGAQTITPLTPLPVITDPVLIDGTTQPGFAGTPIIELNGAQMLPAGDGLEITASNTTIRGLVIGNFAGVAIDIHEIVSTPGFANVVIEGNFIGTDVTGMQQRANGVGVVVRGGADHLIGGTTPAARNVISGNLDDGIQLSSGTGYRVQGNGIGVAADGASPLGNGGNGVFIPLETSSGSFTTRVMNVTIGGLEAGAGNVIAFNAGSGIQDRQAVNGHAFLSNSVHSNAFLGHSFNLANWVVLNEHQNNFDQAPRPQYYPVLSSAQSAGGQTTISGYFDGSPNSTFLLQFFSNRSVELSGFGEGETFLGSATVTTDANGHVDFAATLPVDVPNRRLITATATDSANNTSQFSRRLAAGDVLTNVFTVNSTDDVDDGVADAAHTSLREAIHAANNHPGPDEIRFAIGTGVRTIAPLIPLPAVTDPVVVDATTQPGFAGSPIIELSGAQLERVQGSPSSTSLFMTGLAILADDSTIKGLVINRFFEPTIAGAGTPLIVEGDGNVIEGNYIGINVAGTSALPNRFGLRIFGSGNRIGGTSPQARNVLSGNNQFGLELFIGASDNLIQGNFIGTNAAGTAALANGVGPALSPFAAGVRVHGGGQGNVFGGSAPGAGNLISGNNGHGLLIQAAGTVVQGNFIGTDITGTRRLGNVGDGVVIDSHAHGGTVGGTTPDTRNVISANRVGVMVIGSEALIQGNHIGTDVAGILDLGNNMDGVVVLQGTNNRIGGTIPDSGNLISGNNRFGVLLAAVGASSGHRIEGNRIGTQANGTSPLGNSSDGITAAADFINASTNGTGPVDSVIGGLESGALNTVAFNGRHGVNILAGRRIGMLSNSIHSNTQRGIDLNGDGVTPNDPGDVDTGDNDLQNFPVLTEPVSDGVRTRVTMTLNTTPNTGFLLQFFSSSAADPSGFGEGQTLLASRTLFSDSAGNVSVTLIFPSAVPAGHFITSTATDPLNNTSEFSNAVQVSSGEVGPNQPPSASSGGPYTIDEGSPLALSAALSVDPDGDPLTYSWDINGDGVFGDAAGATPTLTWSQLQASGIVDGPSTFVLGVRVDDSQGHVVTSEPTDLIIRNAAPLPDAGPNRVILEGDLVSLTGTFSDPGDLDTHTFHWSVVASNGQEIAEGSGLSFEFVGLDNGSYDVTFTVTDNDGGVGQQTVNVFAINVPPESPIFGLPQQGSFGVPIHLTTDATDPSPIDTADGFTFQWLVFLNDELVAEGTEPDFTFTPGAIGEYMIELRITDKDFGTSRLFETLLVSDAPPPAGVAPVVTLDPDTSVDEGSPFSAGGFFVDPDPNEQWTATVDFGDGSGEQPLTLKPDKSFDLSHTFFDDGIFDVVVKVKDKADLVGTQTLRVSVNNVPPTTDAASDQTVTEGEPVTLTGGFTDPGTTDTHTFLWTVVADNGDAIPSGTAKDFTFTASDNGTYTLTLRVTDDDGDYTEDEVIVTAGSVAPTATLTNGGNVLEGSYGTVSLTDQFDPSAADIFAGFVYSFDFNNDDTFDVTGSTSPTVIVPATFLDDGPGSRTIRARIEDKDEAYTDYVTTIFIENVAPTATLTNNGPAVQGADGLVSFIGQHDPSSADTSAGFTYSYDFDNDGTFEVILTSDASVAVPGSFLSGTGSQTVRARIEDKDQDYTDYTTEIVIGTPVNEAPVAHPQQITVTEDGSAEIMLSASDAETPESALVFKVISLPSHGVLLDPSGLPVDVGSTFTGPPALVYQPATTCDDLAADGFTFVVTDDGAAGAAPLTSAPATIDIAALPAIADGAVAIDAGGIVRIGGTANDDDILVTHTSDGNFLKISFGSSVVSDSIPLADANELRIWARGGNDRVELVDLALAALLSGGGGNDILIGAAGDEILLGGSGDDELVGASGDDFLLGGLGADRLVGAAGHDVLFAEDLNCYYSYDRLRAILDDWKEDHEVAASTIDDLFENSVLDDAFDQLTGSSGDDWFLVDEDDVITDNKNQKKDDLIVTV